MAEEQGGTSFFDEFMGDNATDAVDFSSVAEASMGQTAESPTATDEGQTAESPTATGEEGAGSGTPDTKEASESDSSTDDKGEGEADEGTGEDDKTLPFDQNPKWKAARAAEKRLDDILSKHGLEDTEDLESALATGMSLKELIGATDAKQLLKDSQELRQIKEYWARQEAEKLASEETPEQTTERLKRENAALRQHYETKEADRRAIDESNQLLVDYSNTVDELVSQAEGLTDVEKDIVAVMLGVDNPMDDVDISDKRAVKSTVNMGVSAFKEFVANVKQQAIDDYVAGKSDITTVAKGDGSTAAPVARTKRQIPKNASEEQVFADAKSELLELLEKASA